MWSRNITMACDIETSLHCRSTSDIQGLSLYFKPDSGDERRVFICASISDTECGNDSGVSYKLLNPTHADIILPDHLRNENGTFRCVMRGALQPETQKCWWSPGAGSQNASSTVNTNVREITEFNLGEASTFITEPESEDTSTKPITGAVVGALAAIVLIIVVGCLLFRHFQSKKSPEGHGKCSIGGSSSCIEAQKRGLCKWYIRPDNEFNGLSSQLHEGTDTRQTPLLSSNSENNPHRENGYSKTEDDKNEPTSVKINMDAGVGMIDENRRLADQT